MISPRWKKVILDLSSNKTRTILTMMSIAIGVFAVGIIITLGNIALPDMQADYQSVHPHSGAVYCAPFDETLLPALRSVPGVSEVEGRSTFSAQMLGSDGQKYPVQANGIPQLKNMRLDLLKFPGQAFDLQKKEILLDRSANFIGLKPGDNLVFELPDGRTKTMLFKGYVHDVSIIPYGFAGAAMAYVSPETIEWLGGTRQFTKLIYTVTGEQTDSVKVNKVGNAISDKLKKGGIEVYGLGVYSPGKHFATDIFVAVMAILNVLGGFTVFLSAFLVINTINALMAQHIRQIGIMKSIGGDSNQIMGMYMTVILTLGLIAYLVAVPLSSLLGYQVAVFMSGYINFDLRPFRLIPEAMVVQGVIAFLVPVGASLVPVLGGTKVTVREALSTYGTGAVNFGAGKIDRLVEQIRFFSRPVLISIRNSIRRKSRLIMTLCTLTLGGSIFIAVFNLWGAFDVTMRQVEGYFLADINVSFTREHRLQKIGAMLESVPGVVGYEGWKYGSGRVLSTDKKSEVEIEFLAPPVDSTLIKPIMTSGRWLVPQDENAVVIGNHLIKERPDLKVGDDIVIKVNEKEYPFHIVGIYKMAGNTFPPLLYTSPGYLSKITESPDQIYQIRIITAQHDLAFQQDVSKKVQAMFKENGIDISYVRLGVEWRNQQTSQTDVMIYFLMVMALLIAMVGGLGLMGTMGMNVLERVREIGVMRAVGASNFDIQKIVVTEGLLIGVLSWLMGFLLAIPITFVLNYAVGVSMFTTPLDFVFGFQGALAWLLGVLGIAALASALPAWNASRLTIREVLAYE